MAAVDFTKLSPEMLDAVLESPAMKPPPGEVSIFDNPPNQNAMAVAIMSVCIGVVVLCLVTRGYARLILLKRVQAQEYLILVAFGCFLGWSVCTMKLSQNPGYYVHTWNVKLRQTVDMGFQVHVGGQFYSACLPLLKSAIIVEWLSMFVRPGNRNWFFWACWTVIGMQIAFAIAIITALNLACIPTKKKWEFWVPGKCINAHNMEIASASFQLASDVIVLFLPQKAIWDLQMSFKKKLGVTIIFSLGVLACVAAAFRLAATIPYAASEDMIYTIGPVCFWGYAEMTCGFIVVCVPCVPKILLESGAWRKMKKAVGMSVTAVTGAAGKSQTNASAMRSKPGRSVNKSYQEIDDTELKPYHSESTEHLRENQLKNEHGIVRTTRVTVTQNESMPDNNRTMYDHEDQWR